MVRLYLFLLLFFTAFALQSNAQCTAVITPANQVTVCAGTTTTFTANAGTTYQWKLNGTVIAGATNQSYTATTAGTYSVTVTNGSCSATSSGVTLVVNPLPTVTTNITPSANLCVGDTANICAVASAMTYQWTPSTNITSFSGGCIHVAATTPGTITYTVLATNSVGCTNTATATVTFQLAPSAPTASSNSPVGLGQNIMLTATSNALSGTYSWIGPNGYTSTLQNPQINNATTTMSGTYSVRVNQNGCNSPYATTNVIVSDLVWPGDVNYDLTVDNNDVLALGVAYGQTGVARAGASNNWVGQYCPDWSTAQAASTANMKHADCNGDGTVNSTDQAAITQNYALVHVRDEHSAGAKVTGLPDLYFDTQGVTFTPGTTVTIPIKLGTTTTSFNQFYGLAAKIKISGLTLAAPMQVTYNNSWIGNASNTLRFTKDVTNDRLDWAYVRNDHQNISGNGTIGELVLTIPANAPTSQVTLQFDNVRIIDKNAAIYVNMYNVIDATSSVFATGVQQANELINAAAIVPNPSGSNATIQLDLAKETNIQVSVTDASGRTVWIKEVAGKAGKQQVQLPASSLAAGIYQVVLKTREGTMLQNIKWMRD